jgi:outer membrane protein assembly factor BamD|tara:strand:+ start:2352 stop:3188 length:837 start_codon:yes stop_codon:yes gene_type:complete
MDNYKFIILLLVIFFINGCSKDKIKESQLNEKNLDLQVLEAYQEGLASLKGGDVLFAAKKFNEAEILFPQSLWAPKSALMAAYSYYSQDYYGDAIAELDRFIKIYTYDKNLDYAYYLLGISHYEQIVSEEKDLQSIIEAKKNFTIVVNEYPKTEYSLDAKFKLDLINQILASKEMYIGRYYFQKQKWIPSINRFLTVVNYYNETIYTEEALYRLVEMYYILGLESESKKYAQLLGYNYNSSEWYKKSYKLFNATYKEKEIVIKNDKKKILQKVKSLFD